MEFKGATLRNWLSLTERIAGTGVWEINLKTNTVKWSAGTYTMLGLEPEDAVQKLEKLSELVHPDDLECAKKQFEQTLHHGATYDIKKRLKHKDGHYIYVHSRAELIYEEGEPAFLSGVFFDITNYEQTKSKLDESRRQAQFLIENVDGIFWEADVQTLDFLYVSPQIEEVLGYSRDEWLSTPDFWRSKVHPSDRETIIPVFKESVQNCDDFNLEYRLKTFDGHYKWFQQRVKVICDKEGHPQQLTGTLVDISEEKALRKALKSEKELFEGLVSHLPSLFFLFDEQGNQLLWNKKLLELSGYSSSEIQQIKPLELFDDDQKNKVADNINKAFEKGSAEVEAAMTTKSGDRIPFLFKATSTKYKGKNCIYGVGTDLRQLKKKDAIIRENQKRFKALIQEGGDVIMTLDPELRLSFVSPSSKSILDLEPVSLEGQKMTDAIHEKDQKRVLKALNTARNEKRTKIAPYRFKNGKGAWRWMETVITNAIHVESIQGLVLNSRDITENQRNLQQLKKSEARYRGLFESQTNYVVRTDLKGRFTFVNDKFSQEYDWLYPDGIIGGAAGKTTVKKHMHRVKTTVGKCINHPGHVFQVVLDKRTKREGGQTTIWDFVCIVDELNQPSEIQCVGIDITARSKFERKLKESNERFELITKTTNDAIWDFDFVNNSFYWGQGFKTLFGYEIDGGSRDVFDLLSEICHPDDLPAIKRELEDKLEGRDQSDDWIQEFRIIRSDGTYAHVRDHARFIRNQAGKITRALGAIADISQQKEFEMKLKKLNLELKQKVKALDRSNQELEQFAYVASHDLQEPLRMVTNFLDLLEKKYGQDLNEKAKTYIHFATDGARRMRELILDLLDFSRAGRGQEKTESFDLSVLLENVIALHRKSIQDKQANITVGDLPTIYSWKVPVHQIFYNLISNALKFSNPEKSPQITIEYEENETTYLFRVRDNGIGIDPDYHEKIFVIFQRLDHAVKTAGTGIGLALVKKIVDNLGGEIWVDSEVGKGTTFSFTLPKMKVQSIEE